MSTASFTDHRQFLNRYYRHVRHVYDLTRRGFLLGRDAALAELLGEAWDTLIEVGPGTGRNLRLLHARRPGARYGGIEASDEMLAHAAGRCPWATLAHGFAEDADLRALLGSRPQRILFSYSLSMVQHPEAALLNARRALAPGGEVIVVDFGDIASAWPPLGAALRAFLDAFHVRPLRDVVLAPHARALRWGPGRYYVIARLPALDS